MSIRHSVIALASAALFVLPVSVSAQSTASSPPSPATATDSANTATPTTTGTPDATPAGQASATPAIGGAVTAGQIVKDTKGAPVGRIESVNGGNVVLATSNSKVTVPVSSFSTQDGALVFAMSAAEVDAAAKAQKPSS